jgi:hypothetical protein
MSTVIDYYKSELDEWKHAIIAHTKEIAGLEKKLAVAIRRNYVKGIGAKVEMQLSMVNKISGIFLTLQSEIQQQENLLKAESKQVTADKSRETQQSQRVLRINMQAAEKEYIDVKFSCHDFLSGTLKN